MARPWNKYSEVVVCPDCEGTGFVPAYRQSTVNDPYPERPCDCGMGEHEPECSVCGFNQVVRGYDCYACQTIDGLCRDELAAFDADAFARAVKVAMEAARADAGRVAA